MALKYIYDKQHAIATWFDPMLVDEGWFDDEFAEQVAAVTFNAAFAGPATHIASALMV